MSAPENPQAFPCVHDKHLQEGMTLRDWFAGQALSARPYVPERRDDTNARRDYLMREHAKALYAMADAMLTTRQEQGK